MAEDSHRQRMKRWPKCAKVFLRASATFSTTRDIQQVARDTDVPSNRTVLNQELRSRGEDPV